jgi:hypothetical protein
MFWPKGRSHLAESTHDDSAAKGAEHRRWRAHISPELLFGLIGMLTGITGLLFAYQSQHEQQVVSFAAYPTAGADDLTVGGLGVRLQLVNQSLRPVIVRNASLWQGKTRLADATGYLRDARELALANVDPDSVKAKIAQFPLNLGAREGRSAALLLDVWNGVSGDAATAALAVDKLNLTLNALGPGARPNPPFELELDLAPGGARRFPIVTLPPINVNQQAGATASGTEPSWVITPLGQPPRLIGLLLRHATAGEGDVELARLDLWKQGSPNERSIERPVIGREATTFPLADLASGAYTVAFSVDGKIVANRSFSLPWRRVGSARIAEGCAVGLEESAGAIGSGSAAWC